MKYSRMKFTVLLFALFTVVFSFGLLIDVSSASAATFNYTDHPMDDSTFRATFTMSEADIQNFLASKNSGLTNFTDIENCGSSSGANYTYYSTFYTCGARVKASKIIYDAARAYGINPQVIIATLQKEQSLITTPNPVSSQLNYAMGYGCPDSSGCSGYAGFFNQVDNGAWQFRTDYELSSGNSYWGYSPASYPCNGPTRYYNKALLPSNDVTFMDDRGTGYTHFIIPNASTATLYCYTPHVFPGSSQQYYSGSYWFVYYFSVWFGGNATPYAFKSSSNNTVYLYVNGFKVAVPTIAMLQDYGISPSSIQVLSQSMVDSIPAPNLAVDGVSPTLGWLVKSYSDSDADGGSVYLISVGQKNTVISMQQFNDFGFTGSDISYLPLSFINTISGTKPLSYYLQTPQSLVFQIGAAQKRAIFDFPSFITVNPSGTTTPVSYSIISRFASGLPISNTELLIRQLGSDTVYLYTPSSGLYYPFPSYDAYSCWGVSTFLNIPFIQVSDSSYIAPIVPADTLGCLVKDGSASTTYILSKNAKYAIPAIYGNVSPITLGQDTLNVINRLPTNSSPLKQAIKSAQSPAIWYLSNGGRKSIPSLSDYSLLGSPQIDTIDSSAVSSFKYYGIALGTGQPVKSPDSPSVYIVSGNTRLAVASSDDFIGYGYSWSNIETFSAADLNQYYPISSTIINKYFYDQSSQNTYLVDKYGCYTLSTSQLISFGKDQSQIIANQPYDLKTFPSLKLSTCKQASIFIKQTDQSTVYWLDAGIRHPLSSWSALVNKSGQNSPIIINLSPTTIQSFPEGTPII